MITHTHWTPVDTAPRVCHFFPSISSPCWTSPRASAVHRVSCSSRCCLGYQTWRDTSHWHVTRYVYLSSWQCHLGRVRHRLKVTKEVEDSRFEKNLKYIWRIDIKYSGVTLDVRLRWSLMGGGRLQEVSLIVISLTEEPIGILVRWSLKRGGRLQEGGRSRRLNCTFFSLEN